MTTDTSEQGLERLICAALTGKLEPLEAAARLPQDIADPDVPGDATAHAEDDVAHDSSDISAKENT